MSDKVRFIDKEKALTPVAVLCAVLGISRQSYHQEGIIKKLAFDGKISYHPHYLKKNYGKNINISKKMLNRTLSNVIFAQKHRSRFGQRISPT